MQVIEMKVKQRRKDKSLHAYGFLFEVSKVCHPFPWFLPLGGLTECARKKFVFYLST